MMPDDHDSYYDAKAQRHAGMWGGLQWIWVVLALVGLAIAAGVCS